MSLHFTADECAYMDYLDNLYDAPDYGLLSRKGDPVGFEVGMNEWLAEQEHEREQEARARRTAALEEASEKAATIARQAHQQINKTYQELEES